MAIFLDTGFIVALKNNVDIHHDHAVRIMERSLKNEFGTIYTSTFVFDEIVTLILIRLHLLNIAIAVGKYLLNSRKIHLINVDQKTSKWDNHFGRHRHATTFQSH